MKYKKIYFMGVKGVGMAALAIIAKEALLRQGFVGQAGFEVAGSDVDEEFITDVELKKAGVKLLVGFKEENVREFFANSDPSECLFVATGAHEGFDNPESLEAKRLGIKILSLGSALGEFMSGAPFDRHDIEGIAITGAHGKTTVSSMVATVLSLANTDPSYAIGTSSINPIGSAGHYGKGKFFAVEADEYVAEPNNDPTPKFLYLSPNAILINNIDFDHPDVYRNLAAVKNAYLDFMFRLKEGGLLVVNGDDINIQEILPRLDLSVRKITFGTAESNEFVISDYKQVGLASSFKVAKSGRELGDFELSVPGYHNAKNATGVIALLMELGVGVDKIKSGLKAFKGVRRRMEIIGTTKNGQILIDDYAHHPEEIKKTLEALKAAYPDKKLVTLFQFHTFSRTKALFSDFVASFSNTDELLMLPTFASRRNDLGNEDMDEATVEEFRKIGRSVILLKNIDSMVKYIERNLPSKDIVIITMGAGDIYRVGEKLAS